MQVDKAPFRGIKLWVMKEFNIPWLNRDCLDYYLSKCKAANNKENDNKENELEPRPQPTPTDLITITSVSAVSDLMGDLANNADKPMSMFSLLTEDTETATITNLSETKSTKTSVRPKGATIKSKSDSEVQFLKVKDYIALECKKIQERSSYVKQGSYEKVINEAKVKFNLPEDVNINKQLMVKQGATANCQVLVAKWEPVSPMKVVEEHILSSNFHVEIIKDPMTPKRIIKLANSLIQGSIYE